MVNGSIKAFSAPNQVASTQHHCIQSDGQPSSLPEPVSCTTDNLLQSHAPDQPLRSPTCGESDNIKNLSASAAGRFDAIKNPQHNLGLTSSERIIHEGQPSNDPVDSRPSVNEELKDAENVAHKSHASQRREAGREKLRRSITGPISNLKRYTWMPRSRSPSPGPRKQKLEQARLDTRTLPSKTETDFVVAQPNAEQVNGVTRRHSVIGRKGRGPISVLLRKDEYYREGSTRLIPRSCSAEDFSLFNHESSDTETPAVPNAPSLERLPINGTESPRKKDALWRAFRNLDGEYQKFQSRPSSTKTSVLRTTLLPFLRTYANHSSILGLRPEDLDRRAVILNKWWTGLLGMLNGRHGESVSGNDRPTVLEATTAIMTRPEWTAIPSHPSKTAKSGLKSRSTTSLGSNMSDFLADSVHQNVKNMFTQNLLAQMAYVVDKMSARSVPASVVSFCGKATGYAFFYCEGVAEILVRLWNITPRSLRRVVSLDKERSLSQCVDAEKFLSSFPPCIHPMSFRALKPMMKYLRAQPHVPIATMYIPWHGTWVTKWAGRDTDLFYIFVKVYVDLASRVLPDDDEARMSTPGWAIVHAQLLVVLERTLHGSDEHRSSDPLHRSLPITFDGILSEADTAAATLPLPIPNTHRNMAENRLIMLLRDSLSSSNIMDNKAQRIFANTISFLLKTAASGISIFDHHACFKLCDFLEEALPILHRFHLVSPFLPDFLEWPFWFEVFMRFLKSQNSMTEIRLLAFIYSMWGMFANDPEKKRDLCLKWLINRETFQKLFNHWCPMVRAFYMRLCIWRISRLDAENSRLDGDILNTFYLRLEENWVSYLRLRDATVDNKLCPVSTAPCSPAPRRCLKIMRDDIQPPSSGIFLPLDGSVAPNPSTTASTLDSRNSRGIIQNDTSSARSSSAGKGLSALFKSFLSLGPSANQTVNPGSSERGDVTTGGFTEAGNGSEKGNKALVSHGSPESGQSGPQGANSSHRPLPFKFSLEWLDETSSLYGQESHLFPPQLPLHAQLSKEHWYADRAPHDSSDVVLLPSKNTGRALAEWAASITECQRFFQVRKAEGVPSHRLVETPRLNVDPFRKL